MVGQWQPVQIIRIWHTNESAFSVLPLLVCITDMVPCFWKLVGSQSYSICSCIFESYIHSVCWHKAQSIMQYDLVHM